MGTTLNGRAEITPAMAASKLITVAIPGTTSHIRTTPLLAPLWVCVLMDVDTHILKIDGGYGPDCWADRQARSGAGLSNHASASAVDVRYDVFKADHCRHASPGQILAAHAILAHYTTSTGKRILGWGGDWQVGTYCDEMHWEIGQAWEPGVGSFVSDADVQNVIKRLGLTVNGAKKAVKVPAKPSTPKHVTIAPFPGVFKEGAHGAYVSSLQAGLVRRGYHLVVDGHFGPQTVSAVKDFQRKNHLGVADGIVGPKTYAAATK
jgi:hypothetical protein